MACPGECILQDADKFWPTGITHDIFVVFRILISYFLFNLCLQYDLEFHIFFKELQKVNMIYLPIYVSQNVTNSEIFYSVTSKKLNLPKN